jgi:hypothetical protein
MPSTAASAGGPQFHSQLLAVRGDPGVRSYARKCARGDPDLAEDGLDEAYWAVARVRHPERIGDLRAYFCRAVSNAISRLRNQLGAAVIEEFDWVVDTRQDRPGCHPLPPRPLDEQVSFDLLVRTWLERLAGQREELATWVVGRSPDRDRYRAMIVTVAMRLLLAVLTRDVSDADFNRALCVAYPKWFAEPGCAVNTLDQRLSRARADVRALLRALIDRGDLYR